MSKQNSWFKLSTLKPGCASDAMFGCAEFKNETDSVYPDRSLKLGATIIWIPSKSARVCVASYIDAYKNNDAEAIKKLDDLGIPAGINFGYKSNDDLSCMYEIKKVRKNASAKKKDSVKIMRAKYAAEFDDGSKFKAGDIVKILFRKEFVEDVAGTKRFRNVYVRPTAEEINSFMKEEA